MRGVNNIVLCGGINEPTMVNFTEGENPRGRILEFSLATERSYPNKNEEWVNVTEWHIICVHAPRLIEKMISLNLCKGMTLAVTGRLQYDTWVEDGKTRKRAIISASTIEIVAKPHRNASEQQSKPALAPDTTI